MEKLIEKTRISSHRTPQAVSMTTPEKVSKTTTHPNHPGVEFDENGEPIGACTVVELFDELDRKFVDFYGEEGRRRVNARREKWNKKYPPWHFEMF